MMRKFYAAALLSISLALAACQTAPSPAPHELSAAQVAVLKDQGFQHTDEGWAFDLSEKLLFGTDVAHLSPESQLIVARIGRALLKVGISKVRLDGYTDTSGNSAYNDKLSASRSAAVAEILISVGMARENITVRGLGASNPVADNSTEDGRAQNRRVAIIVEVP